MNEILISEGADRMFTPKNKIAHESFWIEKAALLAALFFFAFGIGLMTDGKQVYADQLKLSQRVDFKAVEDPFRNN